MEAGGRKDGLRRRGATIDGGGRGKKVKMEAAEDEGVDVNALNTAATQKRRQKWEQRTLLAHNGEF